MGVPATPRVLSPRGEGQASIRSRPGWSRGGWGGGRWPQRGLGLTPGLRQGWGEGAALTPSPPLPPFLPTRVGRAHNLGWGEGQASWASPSDTPILGSHFWAPQGLCPPPTAPLCRSLCGEHWWPLSWALGFSRSAIHSAAPPTGSQTTLPARTPCRRNPYLFGAPAPGPRSSARWGSERAGRPWRSGRCSVGAWRRRGACSRGGGGLSARASLGCRQEEPTPPPGCDPGLGRDPVPAAGAPGSPEGRRGALQSKSEWSGQGEDS